MSTTPSIATRYTARYGVRHPAKGEYPTAANGTLPSFASGYASEGGTLPMWSCPAGVDT